MLVMKHIFPTTQKRNNQTVTANPSDACSNVHVVHLQMNVDATTYHPTDDEGLWEVILGNVARVLVHILKTE